MWYIHYGLHIPITHSLFKRKYQMCSKVHQISCKQANGYMFKTNCSSIEHWYKKLGGVFNKKGGRKQLKLCPGYFIFSNKKGVHMWLQPPVFYVYWIYAWRHHYKFIIRYHKTNKRLSEEGFIFQNPGWYNLFVVSENKLLMVSSIINPLGIKHH